MITFFAIPKAFKGDLALIQRNAIQSWALMPNCEIILFGDDEGTADIALEFGLRHISDITRNKYGTPQLDNIFKTAQQLSSSDFLCYINADIILMSDFMWAVERVACDMKKFLMVGQRWDIDIDYQLDFNRPEWEQQLLSILKKNGKLHDPTGIDYFFFKRGLFNTIPPFALGRTIWDNWLIYQARSLHVPVINATEQITAVHQNHDYLHLANDEKDVWQGPEARTNLEIAGGYDHVFTTNDATHILTPSKIKRDCSWRKILRHMISFPFIVKNNHPFLNLLRIIARIPRRKYILS